MSKHTPGPWMAGGAVTQTYFELGDGSYYLIHNQDIDIAFVRKEIFGKPADANARLIAAAPQLLEALKAVVRVADRNTVEFDLARAAIRAAEVQG